MQPYLVVAPELPSLPDFTLHNISIDPTRMERPAEGAIFGSNHLGKLGDTCSKLARTATHYCEHCVYYYNPTNDKLEAFITNRERDFDSHHQHIYHTDSLLGRDARHCVWLGYPVIRWKITVNCQILVCVMVVWNVCSIYVLVDPELNNHCEVTMVTWGECHARAWVQLNILYAALHS